MRKSRFTPEQIVRALREGDAERPVGDLCRQLGVSEATFCLYGLLPAFARSAGIMTG